MSQPEENGTASTDEVAYISELPTEAPIFSGQHNANLTPIVETADLQEPPQQTLASYSSAAPLIYEAEFATVRVGGEDCIVDLTACSPQAAFFAGLREQRRKAASRGRTEDRAEEVATEPDGSINLLQPDCVDMELPDFPGGISLLREVVRYLQVTAAEERAASAAVGASGMPAGGALRVDPSDFHLELNTDNIGSYLEAAAVLRCPRLLRDTVLAPAAKELPSRKVLALLEKVILFTADAASPEASFMLPTSQGDESITNASQEDTFTLLEQADGEIVAPSPGNHGDHGAEAMSQEQVVQAFSQVIQRLCARLDAVDFKLTASLAAGSPWASLQVLKSFRDKVENVGRMNYAMQSVASTVKSLFVYEQEKSAVQQVKQDWKEHHFALHVFRKHIIEATLFSKNTNLRASAELSLLEQENEVRYSDDEGDEVAPGRRNGIVQQSDDDIPEAICDGVMDSTLTGLAGLATYCDPAQTPPVIAAAMIRSLLLVQQTDGARRLFEAVFVRSRKAQAMVVTGHIPIDFLSAVKAHRAASLVLRRLLARYESMDRSELCHLLGNVLLEEFRPEKHCEDIVLSNILIRDLVIYCRVQTRTLEDTLGTASSGYIPVLSGASGETELLRLRKVGEKLFNVSFVRHHGFLPTSEASPHAGESWPAGPPGEIECPWDSGELDLPLLQNAPTSEDALHLARRVLLRGFERRSSEFDVPAVARLWSLGRWQSCRDALLISEVFKFLCRCWQALRAGRAAAKAIGNTSDCLSDEESLFSMFADLEFWRLPPAELLTPWVPPQLLACHLASRCKHLDLQQRTLAEENQKNLAEINRLRSLVNQLSAKLEAVDSRSVQSMQKQSEVADTLRSLR